MKKTFQFLLTVSLVLGSISAQARAASTERLQITLNDPIIQGILSGIQKKFPESQPCTLPTEQQFTQACPDWNGGAGCNFDFGVYCKLGTDQYACSRHVRFQGTYSDTTGATVEEVSMATACP